MTSTASQCRRMCAFITIVNVHMIFSVRRQQAEWKGRGREGGVVQPSNIPINSQKRVWKHCATMTQLKSEFYRCFIVCLTTYVTVHVCHCWIKRILTYLLTYFLTYNYTSQLFSYFVLLSNIESSFEIQLWPRCNRTYGTSLICFIVWFHVFICVLCCVLFLSFYAFAFSWFYVSLLYNMYVCYISINDIHTYIHFSDNVRTLWVRYFDVR